MCVSARIHCCKLHVAVIPCAITRTWPGVTKAYIRPLSCRHRYRNRVHPTTMHRIASLLLPSTTYVYSTYAHTHIRRVHIKMETFCRCIRWLNISSRLSYENIVSGARHSPEHDLRTPSFSILILITSTNVLDSVLKRNRRYHHYANKIRDKESDTFYEYKSGSLI